MNNLIQMIEEINEAVDNTLSITCYGSLWDLSSYGDNTFFRHEKGRLAHNKSLFALIKEAYTMIREDRIPYRKYDSTKRNEILHKKHSLPVS